MKKIITKFKMFPSGSYALSNREITSKEEMEQYKKELVKLTALTGREK